MRTLRAVVKRHRPIPVERDADDTLLLRLEGLAVGFDGCCVREDDMVADTE